MTDLPAAGADVSPLKRLAALSLDEREERIATYAAKAAISPAAMKVRLLHDWRFVGRPKQQPPPEGWTYWMILAGRGFGKTRTGAEWAKKLAVENPGSRFALVGPTLADTRETMVEGETGLLSILPDSLLRGESRSTAWNRGPVELYLANGSMFRGFSSVEPDRLRGPQHHYAWGDEVSSWKDAHRGDQLETTFSNLKLGTRLGEAPRFCFTTTPKANRLTTEILSIPEPMLAVVRGSSYENRDNLSEVWWQTVVAPYEGTRLGLQEIHAHVLEDIEGALWNRATIDNLRIGEAALPTLARVVVAVDPNASSDEGANSAGIVVVARDGRTGINRHGFVLDDRTVTKGGPRAWADACVRAYHEYAADRIVAEKNQGGEMVGLTIQGVDPNVPIKLVSASKGKRTRAEPIAALYEGSDSIPGRVHHVGYFPELEAEMTTWTPEAESPDRMDALVWGLTELMLGPSGTATTSVPRGRIPTATSAALRR